MEVRSGMDDEVTIATAIIFCHRFFLRQSHAKNDRRTIATVCMFLAGKVEETPRPLKDVILVSYEIINKKDAAAVQRIKHKEVYEQQKEHILLGERIILGTLELDSASKVLEQLSGQTPVFSKGHNRKEKSLRLLTQDFVKLSCALMINTRWSGLAGDVNGGVRLLKMVRCSSALSGAQIGRSPKNKRFIRDKQPRMIFVGAS
ncbi:hypothetical protein CASFOL_001184 [Castilleja foliolosa]|uniref:Cyclin N-terminal domain-containing protein n=1 Tax=Castilleja foliolosa TaxID=1961234 RepID=A0ABD3EM42_9LAMI